MLSYQNWFCLDLSARVPGQWHAWLLQPRSSVFAKPRWTTGNTFPSTAFCPVHIYLLPTDVNLQSTTWIVCLDCWRSCNLLHLFCSCPNMLPVATLDSANNILCPFDLLTLAIKLRYFWDALVVFVDTPWCSMVHIRSERHWSRSRAISLTGIHSTLASTIWTSTWRVIWYHNAFHDIASLNWTHTYDRLQDSYLSYQDWFCLDLSARVPGQ